ncbi:MAG: hypothetical protein HC932_05970 [Thermales bacterium]|nr:hypothetical protein [Thermales bacterium]
MAQFNESKSEFDSMVLGKDKANIKKTLSELEVSFDDSLRLEIEIPKKDRGKICFIMVGSPTIFDSFSRNAFGYTSKQIFCCFINNICIGYYYHNPNTNLEIVNLPVK